MVYQPLRSSRNFGMPPFPVQGKEPPLTNQTYMVSSPPWPVPCRDTVLERGWFAHGRADGAGRPKSHFGIRLCRREISITISWISQAQLFFETPRKRFSPPQWSCPNPYNWVHRLKSNFQKPKAANKCPGRAYHESISWTYRYCPWQKRQNRPRVHR